MKKKYEKPVALMVPVKMNDIVCTSSPIDECDEIVSKQKGTPGGCSSVRVWWND